jgi:hypothetical protein
MGNVRKPLLPNVKYDTALQSANERREQLQKTLADQGDATFLRQEFLEIPPTFEFVEPRSFADILPEAYAQTVRLKWQLSSNELLLLERLIDAVVVLKRSKARPPLQENYEEPLSIKIEYLGRSFRERGFFPWRAVIETDNPEFYREAFHSLSDWLGIGVDLAPTQKVLLFGQCEIPQGVEGVVGGIVVGQDEFGMTCSHVISPNCGSLELKGEPDAGGEQPDAALIKSGTSCFELGERRLNKRPINVAPSLLIESCIINKTNVVNLNLNKGNNGFIMARVGAFAVGKVLYRFPHLQVISKRILLGFITIPFVYRYFSEPGNSGSWIGETDTESWIGMVIGGSRNPPISYVAEAQPLLDYFELYLSQKAKTSRSKLTPYRIL